LVKDKRKAPGSFIKLLHQQERKSLISQDKFGPQPRMYVIGLKPLQILEAWCGIERGIAKNKKRQNSMNTLFSSNKTPFHIMTVRQRFNITGIHPSSCGKPHVRYSAEDQPDETHSPHARGRCHPDAALI
jgi:hypothetical protein